MSTSYYKLSIFNIKYSIASIITTIYEIAFTYVTNYIVLEINKL